MVPRRFSLPRFGCLGIRNQKRGSLLGISHDLHIYLAFSRARRNAFLRARNPARKRFPSTCEETKGFWHQNHPRESNFLYANGYLRPHFFTIPPQFNLFLRSRTRLPGLRFRVKSERFSGRIWTVFHAKSHAILSGFPSPSLQCQYAPDREIYKDRTQLYKYLEIPDKTVYASVAFRSTMVYAS